MYQNLPPRYGEVKLLLLVHELGAEQAEAEAGHCQESGEDGEGIMEMEMMERGVMEMGIMAMGIMWMGIMEMRIMGMRIMEMGIMAMGKRSRMRIILPQVDLSPESRGKPALKRTTGDFHPFIQFNYW